MTKLAGYVEVVESAYETMLAYAAQGRESDLTDELASVSPPSEIRLILTGLQEALQEIELLLSAYAFKFARVVAEDIQKVDAALELVLAQPELGSELIDNLNASIHLRAVLTDLFLLDEVEL